MNIITVIAYNYGFRETNNPDIWKHYKRPFRFRFSPRKVHFEVCRDKKHYEAVFSFWKRQLTLDDVVLIDYYLKQHFV